MSNLYNLKHISSHDLPSHNLNGGVGQETESQDMTTVSDPDHRDDLGSDQNSSFPKSAFPKPAPMDLYVSRIHLTNFRSYEHMTLEPEGKSVVLTGPNGAGKTNILEALSFLAPGRGLRRRK